MRLLLIYSKILPCTSFCHSKPLENCEYHPLIICSIVLKIDRTGVGWWGELKKIYLLYLGFNIAWLLNLELLNWSFQQFPVHFPYAEFVWCTGRLFCLLSYSGVFAFLITTLTLISNWTSKHYERTLQENQIQLSVLESIMTYYF